MFQKIEKWCGRMVAIIARKGYVIAPCRRYLGFVHPATRYCEPCRKAVLREKNNKYSKEPGQQGGEHGRWGPAVSNYEIVGRKALAILNAVERSRDCYDCIRSKKIRSTRCRNQLVGLAQHVFDVGNQRFPEAVVGGVADRKG